MAYIALALTVISFFMTLFFVPDTPRFYYSVKNFEKARQTMDEIRRRNGKEPKSYLFDTEVEELEKN